MDQRGSSTAIHATSSRQRLWIACAVLGAAFIAILTVWLRTDWAWSPVDDAGHVIALHALIDEHGLVGGVTAYAEEMFRTDLSWGLFRPSYWAYPPLFYLLSPTAAHVVRLLMLIVAIAGPVMYFRRKRLSASRLTMVALLLLGAASSLYIGLFLVSLQELSAMAFVGLGLLVPNRWARLLAWTVAAWFKAPFAWLLIGQAIVDWRRGERRLAAANGLLGAGTLVLAALLSRSGSYTERYALDPYAIWSNAQRLIEPMNALLLLSVLWWLAVTQQSLRRSTDTIVFGIGWFGYTAQMLPWGVTAYYMGPISFLLGLLLASMLAGPPGVLSRRASLIGLCVPVLITLYLTVTPLMLGFRINAVMAGLQRCLVPLSTATAVMQGQLLYVTTSEEGPIRLMQNLHLVDGEWVGSIRLGGLTAEGTLEPEAEYLLNVGDRIDPLPAGLTPVCEFDEAQVYRS